MSVVKTHFPLQFESERLLIEKHRLATAVEMYECVDRDRERLRRYLPWVDYTSSVGDEAAYIHLTHTQWDRHELYDYSLRRKEDGAFIGSLGVHGINWAVDSCELGYWLACDFEGYGYMTEAARALTALCFRQGFVRVEIRFAASNQRSESVARRLGFSAEGRLRQATVNLGQREDLLLYAALKSEWQIQPPAESV